MYFHKHITAIIIIEAIKKLSLNYFMYLDPAALL